MRVKINGTEYQVPELDDLTFREANHPKSANGGWTMHSSIPRFPFSPGEPLDNSTLGQQAG